MGVWWHYRVLRHAQIISESPWLRLITCECNKVWLKGKF